MTKKVFPLLLVLISFISAAAQEPVQITTTQAKSMYKDISKKRVSVHDPSVVYEPSSKTYYIFGTMRGVAKTTDMQNWTAVEQGNETNLEGGTWKVGVPWKAGSNNNAYSKAAFSTPAVKKVTKGGAEVDFPAFDAFAWSNASIAKWNIAGNLWAPDIIWNETMQKWCMYFSVNGEAWLSSIVLLTADKITGPYEYQGPVVITGFRNTSIDYHKTDLELAIGSTSTLPSRYNLPSDDNGKKWGDRWPHAIDPCVFYDEQGELWMSYGSWSGGIWMLKLNKANGLRDYDVTYPSTDGSKNTVSSDPYFGKKIAGGLYVSGEGSYIEHIGNYYYLFVSYGGFAPDGGYEMRVFRSENPDGPYKDASSRSAIFTSWVQNYGLGNDNRGAKIMGAYNNWGFLTTGECAQGHNSIIAAEDGRTYLIYHTKFNDGNPQAGFHSVRTHQVFLNKQGWLVAAPFEYNGESTTDNDIATKQLVDDSNIPGTYKILIHKYKMDYAKMEEVTPVEITLSADGKVSGAYSGTWSLEAGTSYLTIVLGGVTYNGVLIEEQMDGKSIKTIAFTAMANSGVCVWGYKMRPDHAVAWQVNNQKVPVSSYKSITSTIDLYAEEAFEPNILRQWTPSHPDIFSAYGRFNPSVLTEETTMEMTYRVSAGNYYWQQTYNNLKAKLPTATEWTQGLVALYDFDKSDYANLLNQEEKALLKRSISTTALPAVKGDELCLRNNNIVQLAFGANGKESYVEMPNPLYGQELKNGATLSFWVRRLDVANLWDALYGFYDETTKGRVYLTGNLYSGYNDNNGKWIDINHPSTTTRMELADMRWHQVTVVFSRLNTTGIRVFVDGVNTQTSDVVNGDMNGTAVSRRQDFDYNNVLNHLANCKTLFLGKGSFWGSAPACFDDVMIYNRELSIEEARTLYRTTNCAFDYEHYLTGIQERLAETPEAFSLNAVYDLKGRYVGTKAQLTTLRRGIYVCNGKKYIIR